MDTLKRSRNTTVVLTASGEVHTHEGAQVFVQFVIVQLLEQMPVVLSPGKLCEDHGHSYERVSGQEPRLIPNEKVLFALVRSMINCQFRKQFVLSPESLGPEASHLDRTPTHNTHLCSTVSSQARNASHALGSSHTD